MLGQALEAASAGVSCACKRLPECADIAISAVWPTSRVTGGATTARASSSASPSPSASLAISGCRPISTVGG